MPLREYNGLRRLTQSTCANAQFQPILFEVLPEYETATNLPLAGDDIAVAQFTTNLWVKSMKLYVPTGHAWSGGAVSVGWTLDGPHPVDVLQVPTHRAPHVDDTLFDEFDRFTQGTPVAPTATGAEVIVQPIHMLDTQYNGGGDWRGFDWNLTIRPAAAPAEDDRLLIMMEYAILAT